MDSLTQLVLGGAVGEAVLGKKVGNRAVLWGAIGGTIPDLDTLVGSFLSTVDRLEIHRGFSHSIVFAVLSAPLLGWLVARIYRSKKRGSWRDWTQLMFWSIFTHPLLDIFTTWGTQLFWPLEWRIAIQSVFVIDPLYTVPFLLCLLTAMFLNRNSSKRAFVNRMGISISSFYLLLTVIAKWHADTIFQSAIEKQKVEALRFDSRPTLMNSILWTSNIETKEAFFITYYSLLDKDQELEFYRFEKNETLLNPYRNVPEVEKLIRLTKGFYTIEKTESGIAMNDLRFGLTEGFNKGKGSFVFTYFISNKGNKVVVEQKRQSFKGVGRIFNALLDRIVGEQKKSRL